MPEVLLIAAVVLLVVILIVLLPLRSGAKEGEQVAAQLYLPCNRAAIFPKDQAFSLESLENAKPY